MRTRNRLGLLLAVGLLVSPTAARSQGLQIKEITGTLGLHRPITVEIDSLQAFLATAGRSAGKFVLYLDWRPIEGLGVRVIPGTNKLVFDVERTDNSRPTWNRLLGKPLSKGFAYALPVSVGYADQLPVQSTVKHHLVVARESGFLLFGIGFLIILGTFIGFAARTPIIRDARSDVPAGKLPPYSLGKTQMAFWFFLIVGSYLLIWIVTGDPPTVSDSILALMGISAGTALGAVVVTNSKASETEEQIKKVLTERAGLETRNQAIDTLVKGGGLTAQSQKDLTDERATNEERIKKIDKALNQETEGFFRDILTDVDGISLHRFQIAIWTVVLGLIFVTAVYNTLGMPEFGGTLVALMGISAGTYIGFKFPEKQV